MAALTVESVLEAADAAVDKRGEDFRYPRKWRMRPAAWKLWRLPWRRYQCVYVQPDGSGPACLIGEILAANGTPLEELAWREGQSALAVISDLYPDTGAETTMWLDRAQSRQDDGERWGSIVGDLHEVLDPPKGMP